MTQTVRGYICVGSSRDGEEMEIDIDDFENKTEEQIDEEGWEYLNGFLDWGWEKVEKTDEDTL